MVFQIKGQTGFVKTLTVLPSGITSSALLVKPYSLVQAPFPNLETEVYTISLVKNRMLQ